MLKHIWPLVFWKRSWWQQWFRVSNSSHNIAVLGSRQIYIIPTRWGLVYALMVFLLLLGSINYSLSLGHYLTFLLASLGVIAMLHTWLNFAHLEVEILGAKPVFAGEHALVNFKVNEHKNRQRHSIVAHFDQQQASSEDIPANGTQAFSVPLLTQQRGWLTMPRLILHTEFPLGLFHAWAVINHPLKIMGYASPSQKRCLASSLSEGGASNAPHPTQQGDDDFNGHKTYQIGDAPSRLDWKASSRGIGLFTKQYSGNAQEIVSVSYTHLDVYKRQSLKLPDVFDTTCRMLKLAKLCAGSIL